MNTSNIESNYNELRLYCQTGISGNMMVGALLDGGVPISYLREELFKLRLHGYTLICEPKEEYGLLGTYFNVELHEHEHEHGAHVHRGFVEIKEIIDQSCLSKWVKEQSIRAFYELGMAEAKVHETSLEEVHFHEVGAIDCIIDIVGTMICLEYLGKPNVSTSFLHVGRGTVHCAHGEMEIPTPATKELLENFVTYTTDIEGELVTPTGAALVRTLCQEQFETDRDILESHLMPRVKGTWSYGFGSMRLRVPNALVIEYVR